MAGGVRRGVDEDDTRRAVPNGWLDRRTLVGLAALTTVGLFAVARNETKADGDEAARDPLPKGSATPLAPGPATAAIAAKVLWNGPDKGRQIAWTVDDGYDDKAVAGYVDFAKRTGTPLTFLPNGAFQGVWNKHAADVR